ncbi:MAG TPA: hypothetical protein VGM31_07860 [Puia sp.]|jgi:hypothetical protein
MLIGYLLLFAGPSGEQGIVGTVFTAGGNQMPAPGIKRTIPKDGIRAVVCVFERTNISQVERVGTSPYYKAIHTRMIQQADTDDKGHFKILLPPGHYSIFTKKGDLFYASRRDEKNDLAPVEVLPGVWTKVQCWVESDHKRIY